jgi:hypothetical protein
MALPPPWLAIHAALEATLHGPEYQQTSMKQRAQDIVEHFEAMGWRLVPSYAVDEAMIPEGLKMDPKVEAGLRRLWAAVAVVKDEESTSMTVEEFAAMNEWCPECETSPGGCPPGTCPGRIGPQTKETNE